MMLVQGTIILFYEDWDEYTLYLEDKRVSNAKILGKEWCHDLKERVIKMEEMQLASLMVQERDFFVRSKVRYFVSSISLNIE